MGSDTVYMHLTCPKCGKHRVPFPFPNGAPRYSHLIEHVDAWGDRHVISDCIVGYEDFHDIKVTVSLETLGLLLSGVKRPSQLAWDLAGLGEERRDSIEQILKKLSELKHEGGFDVLAWEDNLNGSGTIIGNRGGTWKRVGVSFEALFRLGDWDAIVEGMVQALLGDIEKELAEVASRER